MGEFWFFDYGLPVLSLISILFILWKSGAFYSFYELSEAMGNPIVYLAECIMWFLRDDTYLVTRPWKRKKVPSLAPLVKVKRQLENKEGFAKALWETSPAKTVDIPAHKKVTKPKENVTPERATSRVWHEDADKHQEIVKFVGQLDEKGDLLNLFNSLIDETGMYPYWYGCKWGLLIRFQHPLAPIRMHSLTEVIYGGEPSPRDRDPYPPIYVISYDSMEAIAHKSWQVKVGVVVNTVRQSLKFDKDHRLASYFNKTKSSYF